MTNSTPTAEAGTPPNHHARYPGFAGVSGLAAAVIFTIGRDADADLAVALTTMGPDDDVVDIGCGPGVAVRRAAAVGASSVVGVDPAAVMLRVARIVTWSRHRYASAVRYLDGIAEALPVPDGSATVVWSLATVHHWKDLDAGLAEVRRVLRPTGRFLAIERQVESGATGHAGHGWTEDQARRFHDRCRAAGFSNVEVGHHQSGRRQHLSVLSRST